MTDQDFLVPLAPELAQEVGAIQARYESFRASLPAHLRPYVIAVQRPDARMSPGRLSVLALPFWVGEAFGIELKICRTIALGNLFGLLHFIVQDHLSDGGCPVTEIPAFAISGTLLQQQMHDHYLQCFPSQSPFWSLMNKYWLEWADSIAWERQVGAFSSPSEDELLRAARKAAPLKICTSGMALLSQREAMIPNLERAIDMMHMVMQMADDMTDIVDDIAGNRFNTLLSAVLSVRAIDPQNKPEWRQLGRMIFVNKVDEIHIQRMWGIAESASVILDEMGLTQCSDLIAQTVRFAEKWRDHQLREIIAHDLDKFLDRQSPKQQTGLSGNTMGEEEIEKIITNLDSMRRHFADYSPTTAREILKAMPRAYQLYCSEGGRWGPGFIARCTHVTSTTIGRYLRAFKENGLAELDHIALP